jgi:hypothetical protein
MGTRRTRKAARPDNGSLTTAEVLAGIEEGAVWQRLRPCASGHRVNVRLVSVHRDRIRAEPTSVWQHNVRHAGVWLKPEALRRLYKPLTKALPKPEALDAEEMEHLRNHLDHLRDEARMTLASGTTVPNRDASGLLRALAHQMQTRANILRKLLVYLGEVALPEPLDLKGL